MDESVASRRKKRNRGSIAVGSTNQFWTVVVISSQTRVAIKLKLIAIIYIILYAFESTVVITYMSINRQEISSLVSFIFQVQLSHQRIKHLHHSCVPSNFILLAIQTKNQATSCSKFNWYMTDSKLKRTQRQCETYIGIFIRLLPDLNNRNFLSGAR